MAEFSMTDHESREEKIRKLAFRLWQDDGGPGGSDKEYWFKAAKLVDEELSASGVSKEKVNVEPEQTILQSKGMDADDKPPTQPGQRRRS